MVEVEAMRRVAGAVCLVGIVTVAVACGSAPPKAPLDKRGKVTTVELAAFEVRDDQIDRFEHCPPAGEIGQEWLPPLPEWHPPAATASAAVPESAVGASDPNATAAQQGSGGDDLAKAGTDAQSPANQAQLTEQAGTQSRTALRHCYNRGLIIDPTQDGHVGLVLHVDRVGHVVSVETWGACDLAPDALVCMRDVAMHVHLPPPAAGYATVTVPAVFTQDKPRERAANDAYAAAAYVAVETVRPRLHACEEAAKRAGESVFASAVMTADVDDKGHGVHIAVDQWKGGHELLACSAEVIRDAPFPPPPAGTGKIVVPIVFNPRPGTR
jgi:hypothetical protein